MNTVHTNTIYLVRHGENPANLTHEFSYKAVDYSLTPKGRLQAQQTAAYFSQQPTINAIYASPLKRARETAEAIGDALQLPVTIIEEFREINIGDLEGKEPSHENWEYHNKIVQQWFNGHKEIAFVGGENYYTLLARLKAGLLEATRNRNGQRIIIVGHGGIFTRTMPDLCPTMDIEELIRVDNYNCAVTEIELTTSGEKVEGIMKRWASCAHLHGEAAAVVTGLAPFGSVEESQLQ
ncbi:histidine phosphatase family protein [Tengunoibacter tsumagoiensis]|uniref:Phosphoglycerate mutase n=1 Tax=Tengunoibacter tsumagoiensis TaxID=2014871 RepID=A0A402A225_9CHLR|nr:histidine phosphatase family protein [Tengunoibacter tsumagoiensis]GCE13099.1 phosphoglycerate mutase [Tengunoibacter tsumagoiensis]